MVSSSADVDDRADLPSGPSPPACLDPEAEPRALPRGEGAGDRSPSGGRGDAVVDRLLLLHLSPAGAIEASSLSFSRTISSTDPPGGADRRACLDSPPSDPTRRYCLLEGKEPPDEVDRAGLNSSASTC